MDKRQKELLLKQFKDEESFLKELEKIYKKALRDINDKIKILQASDLQSKVYQRKYQEALRDQIEAILEVLHSNEYTSIEEYLDKCYRDGYIGSLYVLQGKDIPLIIPISQEKVVKALQIDSKIKKGLYTRLGADIAKLKKTIANEISRGIASSLMYSDIARNINNASNIGYNNAIRIVRTEGNRIHNAAALDCAREARKRGVDNMKVWDSTLDGKTRDSHRKLHGEVRELEEKFSNGLMFPCDSNGKASEVVNCRCTLVEKSKWELDEDETKYLGDISNLTDEQIQPLAEKLHISVYELRSYSRQIIPVKAKSYEDFKRQYNQICH